MSTLLIKFAVRLESYTEEHSCYHGPLFHRWLPNGREDSITLATGTDNAKLEVWFERRWFVEHGWIRFDYQRQEVDPLIMSQQAILGAGPLLGILEISGLAEDELGPILESKTGDEAYLRLGKRIVQDWFYPPISRLINVLRVYYGQYWICELAKWDSRKESLGAYCRDVNMRWSVDCRDTWTKFLPNAASHFIVARPIPYQEYPGHEDWTTIESTVNAADEPSLAAFALARTHEFRERGQLRNAFIEGITALELALDERMRRKLDGRKPLEDAAQAYYNKLSLKTRVAILASQVSQVVLDNLEFALKAIEVRNDIMHEGKSPPSNSADILSGLLRTIAAVLEQEFRFPEENPVNELASAEDWEKRNHGKSS
jgi:hypothetical protein